MRKLLVIAALLGTVGSVEAFGGRLRENRQERRANRQGVMFQSTESYKETNRGYSFQYSETGSCPKGVCPAPMLVVPAQPKDSLPAPFPNLKKVSYDDGAVDALDEVNAKRAARGLRPYVRDEGLTEGARRLALTRARSRIFGHLQNDFALIPTSAAVTGCAAYPPEYGWMSCAIYDNYTYAGAAWVMGSDGKRYMHLVAR